MNGGSPHPESGWSDEALLARIADPRKRERHAAASPDACEIAAYAAGLGSARRDGSAVVLGMTPELRRLALGRFDRVVSLELSQRAISLYRDWVPAPEAAREIVLRGDWFDLAQLVAKPVAAILGDGVFGNLADVAAHRRLLGNLARALAPGAPLVVRTALIPRGFDADAESFAELLERYRRGELDPDEFGFAARLLGHHRSCYDPETYRLDNAPLFRSCEDAYAAGTLSEDEWRAMRRYRFDGANCIVPEEVWEALLDEAGFAFAKQPCRGRDWYRYYPVYACRLRRDRGRE